MKKPLVTKHINPSSSTEALISAFDTLPVGIVIFNENHVLFINQCAKTIFKLSPTQSKQITSKSIYDFILPEYYKRIKGNNKKILKGERFPPLHIRALNGKKEVIDLEVTSNVIMFNGKKVIQTVFTDISDRVRYQQKLNESEEKFKLIAENANDIIYFFTYHPNAEYLYISPSAEKILGYPLRKFYTDPYFISKHVTDPKAFNALERKLKNEQKKNVLQSTSCVFEYITKSGKHIWLEDNYAPIYDSEGKIKFILGISRDITSEKIHNQEIEQKWMNYQNLVEGLPVGIFIHENGKIIFGNKIAYEIAGLSPEDDNSTISLVNLIAPHQRDAARKRLAQSMRGIKVEQRYYDLINHKKQHLHIVLNSTPILFNGKRAVQLTFQDITREKQLEQEQIRAELAEQTNKKLLDEIAQRSKIEAKLNSIFESTTHLIWTVNRNFELTTFNKNMGDVFEDKFKIAPLLGRRLDELLPEKLRQDYADYWYPFYAKVLLGNTLKFERKDWDSQGNEHFREIFINPIRNESGEIIEIACLAHDISDSKRFEQQIVDQTSKLKAIFESGNQLMWTINNKNQITSFNKNYASAVFNLYGFYPQINKSIRDLSDGSTNPYHAFWDEKYEKAFNGHAVEFTTDRINRDGSKVYRQYVLYPIKNEKGEVLEVSGLGFDITENKLNEEKIKQSLQEKEVLLKEVHHRVKNNMQVISSILNLQSSYVKDTYALNLLKECQNRIKSMAFIHEALYQNKNFESVNFTEYISTISKNLLHSYSVNSEKIKLILSLDNLLLNLDTSIPCGLIINEILSNSLKYAFPDNREGIIFVTLKRNNKKVYIEVGDNGIGIPENVDIKNTQSLGLQLVDTLIEQINGTLTLQRNKGTKFIIEFNAN
ncbi:MAG: PAS domain S-box protein [Bacteroidetes bacterium]|nr:PAS domain S-box protein [Bacteroidota bacterium]